MQRRNKLFKLAKNSGNFSKYKAVHNQILQQLRSSKHLPSTAKPKGSQVILEDSKIPEQEPKLNSNIVSGWNYCYNWY